MTRLQHVHVFQITKALEAAEDKLTELAEEFNHPNFNDRHGDGARMHAIAMQCRAALNCLREAGERE